MEGRPRSVRFGDGEILTVFIPILLFFLLMKKKSNKGIQNQGC